jgi:hypothetical protein
MKTRIAFAFGIAGSLFASSAFAQEVAATYQPEAKFSVGAQLEILPGGELTNKIEGGGPTIDGEQDVDLKAAYSIGGTFDYNVSPYLSVGFAPRLILNITADDVPEGFEASDNKEMDLRFRVKGQYPVIPKLSVYGYIAPGYSMLITESDDIDNAHGFVIGGAVGASYDISPAVFASAELGYHRAYHSTSVEQVDVSAETSLMSFGLGVGTRF